MWPTLPARSLTDLHPIAGPLPSPLQRIVLTGYMGSGKSTVGRLLSERLGWKFSDLDACIEARLGLSVPQIFAQHGEAAFRAAEVQDLTHLLSGARHVIALGGGAPGTPVLRQLLAATPGTAVVHLSAPFAVLFARCQKQATEAEAVSRPLLGEQDSAARRYRERLDMYAAMAHSTADADAGPPEVVAENIFRLLKL